METREFARHSMVSESMFKTYIGSKLTAFFCRRDLYQVHCRECERLATASSRTLPEYLTQIDLPLLHVIQIELGHLYSFLSAFNTDLVEFEGVMDDVEAAIIRDETYQLQAQRAHVRDYLYYAEGPFVSDVDLSTSEGLSQVMFIVKDNVDQLRAIMRSVSRWLEASKECLE